MMPYKVTGADRGPVQACRWRSARGRTDPRPTVLLTLALLACAGGSAPGEDGEGEEPRAAATRADTPAATDTTRAAEAADTTRAAQAADPTRTGEGVATAQGAAWRADAVRRERPEVGMTTMVRVETARHEDFDRIVLEFEAGLPGYRIEYVDRPVRACGSGNVVELRGDGWLSITAEPARAHDDEGRATVAPRERAPGLPALLDLVITCDFEGQVTWVAGVASPNRYRVLELGEPARLVVDVRH